MQTVSLLIERKDREWIEETCRDGSIDYTFSEADGLVGGAEWLQVAIPLATISIPCITKVLLKVIDKYGPTKVIFGDVEIENVRQKDVPKILNKMCALQQRLNNSTAKSND
jgi:hypothetical protein